jgi:hypothetical protein
MNARSIIFGLIITWTVAQLFSCESGRQTKDQSGADSLLIKYQALIDSVDANWAIMMADDDQKHTLMKRLLSEVSYTNNYDKRKYDELNQKIDDLRSLRYDQETMNNSELIDAYDSATMAVTDEIILFARSHPRYPDFTLMAELIDDINSKNNFVLMHRIHYDAWVKELNTFKNKNAEKLLRQNPEIEITEMPLFQLSS